MGQRVITAEELPVKPDISALIQVAEAATKVAEVDTSSGVCSKLQEPAPVTTRYAEIFVGTIKRSGTHTVVEPVVVPCVNRTGFIAVS